jgi:hypothetical protein
VSRDGLNVELTNLENSFDVDFRGCGRIEGNKYFDARGEIFGGLGAEELMTRLMDRSGQRAGRSTSRRG